MVNVAQLILHPSETHSSILQRFLRCSKIYKDITIEKSEDINGKPRKSLVECYELLKETSKSFYLVIMELHPNIRNMIMVYYLVLRALDTVEDNPKMKVSEKSELLETFHLKLHEEDGFKSVDVLLNKFAVVFDEFRNLPKFYQTVITTTTKEMGLGMSKYLYICSDEPVEKDNDGQIPESLLTVKDYNDYCHYVAGTIGEGLSKMFVKQQFNFDNTNHLIINKNMKLYEHLGIFLQKTNIIRSFHKDYVKYHKSYWPREKWSKYVNVDTDDDASDRNSITLDQFVNSKSRVDCLNEMILDAISHHLQETLLYISLIKEQSIFEFCAIPPVLALATLSLLYNNDNVFEKDNESLKLRKTETGYILYNCRTLENVTDMIKYYFSVMLKRKSKNKEIQEKLELLNIEITNLINYKMFPEKFKNSVTTGVREDDYNIYAKQRTDKVDKKLIKTEFQIESNNLYMVLFFPIIIIGSIIYFSVFFEPPELKPQ